LLEPLGELLQARAAAGDEDQVMAVGGQTLGECRADP
jgi:hypothetical protein